MKEATLIVLDVATGAAMESQSGLQMNSPRIFARLERAESNRCAYVLVHPTSNFMAHYLIEPLARSGRTVLALNTRYVANDSMLLMERAIQDVGAGIRFLRDRGYERIVLIGNSGGGSLAALYQSQAERLTIQSTPDGYPIDLTPSDLPPVDAIALLGAHPGRAHTLTDWLDPSLTDEFEVLSVDRALDMYDPNNGPPYRAAWLETYRAAQRRRNEAITQRAVETLRSYALGQEGGQPSDSAFVVHRTMADPRFLDMSLDPNDRVAGTPWGKPRDVNYSANNIGRFTTLRSFLSQWSWTMTRAHGPACLACTTVPVLNVEFGADQIVFPSQMRAWAESGGARCVSVRLDGAPHYPVTANHVSKIVDVLRSWAGST